MAPERSIDTCIKYKDFIFCLIATTFQEREYNIQYACIDELTAVSVCQR